MLWHLPTFFLDSGYRGTPSPLVLPRFVLGIFAGAIVLTWLYEGAGCSVLLAVLWHTSFNLGSATRAGEGVIAPLVTVFVIVSAFVIARGWHRGDQLRPGSSKVPCRLDDSGVESAVSVRTASVSSPGGDRRPGRGAPGGVWVCGRRPNARASQLA